MTTEQRLESIRDEAQRLGAVAAAGVRAAGAPFPQATGETGYYGLPLLKPPTWTWEVPAYFFVGGAAGASAIVAAVAHHSGADHEAIAHDARWIAAAGGIASGALLTADLGRPERFLNMLRVFKLQSPMSVGAWTLTAFSSAAAAAAFADAITRQSRGLTPVRVLGDVSEALAAATGLVMSTYTGVLIGATAIPVWHRQARLLPLHFAASAMASAVSMLELLGHDASELNTLGLMAAAAEVGAGVLIELDSDPASAPLTHGASGLLTRAGGVLAGPVPLILRLMARRLPSARRSAAVASLAGALLTRFAWWTVGRHSVQFRCAEAADHR
jgi:formate-dependent nitrite reductase membrane component NrfD